MQTLRSHNSKFLMAIEQIFKVFGYTRELIKKYESLRSNDWNISNSNKLWCFLSFSLGECLFFILAQTANHLLLSILAKSFSLRKGAYLRFLQW
mgnify:CR=1 FL=1